MKGQNLPPEHHVVRVVPFGKLRLDENNTVIGVNYTAFERRADEDGLSITWMEYFSGNRSEQIVATVRAIRASNFKPSPKSGFAIGQVQNIADACRERKHKIRIIHWPEDDNHAHAEIRQLPRDDLDLLELLASNTWSELVLNANIPPDAESAPPQPPSL